MHTFFRISPCLFHVSFVLWLIFVLGSAAHSLAQGPEDERLPRKDLDFPAKVVQALPNDDGLSFPFARPEAIMMLRSFGIPCWDPREEEHMGIDISPYFDSSLLQRLRKVKIITPAAGKVRIMLGMDSPPHEYPGNTDIPVILELNRYWSLIFMFEPKTSSLRHAREQVSMISVRAGQTVEKGDEIGYLVVGDATQGGYPHLHYSLLYRDGDEESPTYTSYWYILENIVPVPNVPLTAVSGSADPLIDVSIAIPEVFFPEKFINDNKRAAFFCPYEFSSTRAKFIFDYIINKTEYPCGAHLTGCSVCVHGVTCDDVDPPE